MPEDRDEPRLSPKFGPDTSRSTGAPLKYLGTTVLIIIPFNTEGLDGNRTIVQGKKGARSWRAVVGPDVRIIRICAERRSALGNHLGWIVESAFLGRGRDTEPLKAPPKTKQPRSVK